MEIALIAFVAAFASLLTFFTGFGLATVLTPVMLFTTTPVVASGGGEACTGHSKTSPKCRASDRSSCSMSTDLTPGTTSMVSHRQLSSSLIDSSACDRKKNQ